MSDMTTLCPIAELCTLFEAMTLQQDGDEGVQMLNAHYEQQCIEDLGDSMDIDWMQSDEQPSKVPESSLSSSSTTFPSQSLTKPFGASATDVVGSYKAPAAASQAGGMMSVTVTSGTMVLNLDIAGNSQFMLCGST